jgi:hypothetical protein
VLSKRRGNLGICTQRQLAEVTATGVFLRSPEDYRDPCRECDWLRRKTPVAVTSASWRCVQIPRLPRRLLSTRLPQQRHLPRWGLSSFIYQRCTFPSFTLVYRYSGYRHPSFTTHSWPRLPPRLLVSLPLVYSFTLVYILSLPQGVNLQKLQLLGSYRTVARGQGWRDWCAPRDKSAHVLQSSCRFAAQCRDCWW